MTTDPAKELQEAAHTRAASLVQYKADHLRLCHLIIDAHDAGISITDIARFAEVSRQAVYNIIERGG